MFKKISSLIISLTLASVLFAPAIPVFAQTPTPTVDTSQQNDVSDRIEDCQPFSGKVVGCFVEFYMWAILAPSFWMAGIAGEMFDYFIQFSIDSNSYRATENGESFVEKGWGIVRDLVNIMFLFILLYIAIKHILGSGSSATKSLLSKLIMIAIVINFSLFFTRVIVDAGNVLARVFYSAIIENDDQPYGYTSISVGLMTKINPQRILDSNLLNPNLLPQNVESLSVNNTSDKPNQGYLLFIFVLATIVNLTLMVTFISVSILLIGRVIGLWMLMMFSPIAFISKATPMGSFGKLSFDSWLSSVVSLSFMAPVFLFFLFLLVMFWKIIFHTPDSFQGTTIQNLMRVVIPFLFVIFLINFAKKTAKEMAGEFGGMVTNAASAALGGVMTVASAGLGAAAFVGRNTVGRAAGSILQSGRVQERIAEYDEKAKNANGFSKLKYGFLKKINQGSESTLNAAHTSNMDLRSGKAGRIIGYAGGKAITGINMATGENFKMDLGKAAKAKDVARSNYESRVEDEAVKLSERRSKITDREEYDLKNSYKEKLKKYQAELEEKVKNNSITKEESIKKMKEKEDELKGDLNKAKEQVIQRRRDASANSFENELIPLNFLRVGRTNRSMVADAIRRGKKDKSPAERYEEEIRRKIAEEARAASAGGSSSTPPTPGGGSGPSNP